MISFITLKTHLVFVQRKESNGPNVERLVGERKGHKDGLDSKRGRWE